ncbi:MAG: winged helix-turn-helix transcriptional regulator [Thaumarchaeota archaeon]|nr:winged helix-turn-helix transcriptional regulator [Nitrososphaerota archaeon]
MESRLLIGKAMGSRLRLQILEELVKGPRTLNELSASANLKSESVLHHIRILQQVGLVEEFEPIRKGGPGRPYSRYKLTGKMVNIQYPQRNYAMLA